MQSSSDAASPAVQQRRPWTPPAVESLPPLRDLTLQTGGGIPGGDTAPSGGTVF